MRHITKSVGSSLFKNQYNFAISFGKKRVPTSSTLDKYDVVVIGGGLGGVLSTHLDKTMGEQVKIMVAYDQPKTTVSLNRYLY